MNKVILSGRLVKDPEVRIDVGPNKIAIVNYTLAVRRPFAKDGQPEADFIRCKAFGGAAKFANDYLGKGIKINVCGQLQTRTYDAEDGRRNFVTEVLVESQEFAESAAGSPATRPKWTPSPLAPSSFPRRPAVGTIPKPTMTSATPSCPSPDGEGQPFNGYGKSTAENKAVLAEEWERQCGSMR